MSTQLRKALSSNLLFKNIDLDDIEISGIQGKLTVLKEGEYLYRRNEKAEFVYLIVNGRVKSLIEDKDGNNYVKTYEYPEYFGQVEIFDEGLRRGDIVAVEDTFIIGLTKEEILFLASQDNRIKKRLNIKDYEMEGGVIPEIEFEGEFSAEIEHDIGEIEDEIETAAADVKEEEVLDGETGEEGPEEFTENEEEAVEALEKEESAEILREEDPFDEEELLAEESTESLESEELDLEVEEEYEPDSLEEEELYEETNDDSDYNIEEIPELTNQNFDSVLEGIRLVYSNIDLPDTVANCEEALKSAVEADTVLIISVYQDELRLLNETTGFNVIPMVEYENSIMSEVLEGRIIIQNNVDRPEQLADFFVVPDDYLVNSFVLYPVKEEDGEVGLIIVLVNSENGVFTEENIQDIDTIAPHVLNAVSSATQYKNGIRNIRYTNFAKFQNFFGNDIKKPLLVSKRYIEHVLSKNPPDDIRKILLMMNEQIKSASQKFMAVTNYSQGEESLKKIPIMLNKVVEGYLKSIEFEAKSNEIEIIKEFGRDQEVKIDVREFEYCFNHIMRNSIESMKEGGEIRVTTGSREDKAIITVADNGCGIPPVVVNEIFLPFYSFNKPENSGIGLTIAKNIIEKHSGTIQLNSKEDQGTEVVVSLPKSSGF
jgi:hypothetical protein